MLFSSKSIAYKSVSTSPPTTHNYPETATQTATSTFRSGDFVQLLEATGAVSLACTVAATTVAATNVVFGVAGCDSTGTSVAASTVKQIPVTFGPNTLFFLPFAAGTGTAAATTSTAPLPGVTYAIGYGTYAGTGEKTFYCNVSATMAATSVATTATLYGTVHSYEAGSPFYGVWVKLVGTNVHPLTR